MRQSCELTRLADILNDAPGRVAQAGDQRAERADSGVLRVQAEQTSLFRVQNVAQERATLITPTVIVMKAPGSKQSSHSLRCPASRRLFIQPLTPPFLTNAIFGDRFMNNIDVKT